MSAFLSESTAAALARVADASASADATDPLERLRLIRGLLAALDADAATVTAVREAIDNGAAWADVSEAAGIAPTAAKWRWQGTDAEIAARHEAGRKRAARPSAKPTDLPGLSVAEAAANLGVTVQAVYLKVSRGSLRSETVELPDGRKYKRVFLDE